MKWSGKWKSIACVFINWKTLYIWLGFWGATLIRETCSTISFEFHVMNGSWDGFLCFFATLFFAGLSSSFCLAWIRPVIPLSRVLRTRVLFVDGQSETVAKTYKQFSIFYEKQTNFSANDSLHSPALTTNFPVYSIYWNSPLNKRLLIHSPMDVRPSSQWLQTSAQFCRIHRKPSALRHNKPR